MSVNENNYNGAVGIVHFSDESINDPNCLCFATESDATENEKWANLEFGNVFNYKSRIVQLDKDLRGLKKIQFCFSGCVSLQKLFIHGKKSDGTNITKPTDWEEQTFAKYVGSFDELIYSNCGFRHITTVKTVELKFPKLVRCVGDFYNCKSLEKLDTNFSNCLIVEQEFDLCSKLTSVTFDGGLNRLMYAPAMFANCTSLKDFNYELPVLLSGKRMFYKCKLNTASATKIFGSLPEIKLCRSTNTTVADAALKNILTNAGLVAEWKEGIDEPTKLADIINEQNDYWWYYNGNKTGLKHIRRDKSTNYDRMIIYYKYPKYDYKGNEIVDTYASRGIIYDDFGVLDLGVDDNDTTSVKKLSQLKEAIAKGWKIYINNTLQDAFYYEKEGKITIKEETSSVLGSSSRKTIFTGTYSAYGARQKGKDGKLKIKISKISGDEAITLTTDEATIQPKSTTNDDGSFNENQNITLKIKGVERKIKVSSNKTTLSITAVNLGSKYDIILS